MNKLSEHSALARATVSRWRNGARHAVADLLAAETPIALVYNCEPYAVMMASPENLEDFAYGFSLSEGIIANAREILAIDQTQKGPGVSLGIEIPPHRVTPLMERARNMAGRTGCGICGIAEMEQVMRTLPAMPPSPPVRAAAISKAITALPTRQTNNMQCGAVHAAAFADAGGELVLVREDVGRHNALDKLIGAIVREGRSPADGIVLITSRCSMEMAQKTIMLGCPLLVAVSAPTSLAVELAQDHGLTIAAFARGDGFNVYTHPERII